MIHSITKQHPLSEGTAFNAFQGHRIPVVIALTVLMIALIVLVESPQALSAVAQGEASVLVVPEIASLEVGERITLAIRTEDIAELYGADVRLTFDPAVLEVEDTDPSRDGIQIELVDELLAPDWVLKDSADNATGSVWYAVTQLNPREEVAGSGDLARIPFLAIGGGTSPVTISYRKLVRRDGTPIETHISDALITVLGTGPTPTGATPGHTPSPPRPSEPTPPTTPEPEQEWQILLPVLARRF